MRTDEDGKRRLDLVNETMAHHIVNMGAEVAEEGDSKKPRLDTGQSEGVGRDLPELRPEGLPDDALLSFRAAMGGKDASPAAVARKRRAEEEPDEPRSGTWANIGQEEEEDAPIPGGASGSVLRRPADEPADVEGRGDAQCDGDEDMIGSVSPLECSHCSRRFRSRKTMFKHLYHSHDDDGEGAEKKRRDTLL